MTSEEDTVMSTGVPFVCRFWRRPPASIDDEIKRCCRSNWCFRCVQVLAAQTLKIASINGLGDTEKLETELEDEIRWEESRRQPSEIIGR